MIRFDWDIKLDFAFPPGFEEFDALDACFYQILDSRRSKGCHWGRYVICVWEFILPDCVHQSDHGFIRRWP